MCDYTDVINLLKNEYVGWGCEHFLGLGVFVK
jgi:hypothetical protein